MIFPHPETDYVHVPHPALRHLFTDMALYRMVAAWTEREQRADQPVPYALTDQANCGCRTPGNCNFCAGGDTE